MQRGSLKQIKNRKGVKIWRAQWRENGRGRTRILGRALDLSRLEARALLDKILKPIQLKHVPQLSSIALGRFVEDEYLTARDHVWKTSTRLTTEQIIRTHILEAFGDRLLCSITRVELQALLLLKAEEGLSKSVVNHIRWQLVAIFKFALADDLVATNPAAALFLPRIHKRVDKRTADIE